MELVVRDTGTRVVQAEKKYGQSPWTGEELSISKEVAAHNIRSTEIKKERQQNRQRFVIQCSVDYDKTFRHDSKSNRKLHELFKAEGYEHIYVLRITVAAVWRTDWRRPTVDGRGVGGEDGAESHGERVLVSMKSCYQSLGKMATWRHIWQEELVGWIDRLDVRCVKYQSCLA